MAISVKHKFVSAIPDAGDPTIVQPSNWNDTHDLTGTVPVANGGTGAATLTGYVKGSGTSNMTASSTIPNTDISGLGTASTKDAGVANGVATLDGSGTVPISQLPAAVLGALSYQGTWNASTNTPTLTSSVGTKGYYYVVNVAGSTNLNGITDWQVGDWAVYNGTAWQKIDNTDAVTSVNGYTGTVVLGYGDITTGIVAVANGGTGVTASSGANSVMLRDANANTAVNNLFLGFQTVVSANTTTTLTVSSPANYYITGSTGQTFQLPNATTLVNGTEFTFNNNSSASTVSINNGASSPTLIASVGSGGFAVITLLDNSTQAGTWDKHYQAPANVTWSTNTLDYAGSITSATWNGNTVAYNRGGTGQSSAFTAGGIVYGSTTSALAVTPIGTTGQVLTSAGAGIPTWTTPTTGTVTSVTGTSPVVSSGGATPAISMPVATTSVNGYLSSTDWTTFNNKGSGSVTSVAATVPAFLSVTGSPITTTGTLAISYSGTALPAANGGTGLTAVGTSGNVLTSNGSAWVSQAPATTSSSYTRTTQTATASQTTFTVSYTAPYIAVYLNGVLLNTVDYTATNGTSVVLATGATVGDLLDFISFTTSSIAVAGGSNTQVQYNSSGNLGGSTGFTFTGNDLNIPFGTSNSATSSAKIALALSMIA